jgi:polar amino acid transport system substrate-binding protein
MGKLMKKTTIALVAASMLTATAASAQTVRMASEGGYPPYNFINDAGELDGFERELGDELCMRAKLECEWVTNDWESIVPNLVSGNYDTVMAVMSITDERAEVIDFTQNYTAPEPSAYVGLSADVDVSSGVVSAQSATIESAYVATTKATLVEFASSDETLAAVRNGEVDAVLADKGYLTPFVAEDDTLTFVGDDVILSKGVGMGLRKSDEDLKQKFNAAIQSMKEDGSLNALIAKWDVGQEF